MKKILPPKLRIVIEVDTLTDQAQVHSPDCDSLTTALLLASVLPGVLQRAQQETSRTAAIVAPAAPGVLTS